MFAARKGGNSEQEWWLHVPGQRTGGWHRTRCSPETDSVTNHIPDVREGDITQSRAKSLVLRNL